MSIRPTKPGQLCRIIGSRTQVNGEGNGPNMGKTVTPMFLHQLQAADRVPVWHCSSKDVLQTYYGAGYEADFLNDWLEVIEEPDQPKVNTTEDRLEHS
jgi:hypothetical protein